MREPLRVLFLGNAEDEGAVLQELQRGGRAVLLRRAGPAALRSALAEPWGALLGPPAPALDALSALRSAGLDVPVVLVCDPNEEGAALAALDAGAADYVMRPDLRRLGPAVRRELRRRPGPRPREERFLQLLETTHLIPWEAEAQRRFTYVGPQAVQRFGYPEQEWYRPGFWLDHVHPDDRERAAMLSSAGEMATGSYDSEYRLLDRNGEVVWVHDFVRTAAGGDGKPVLHGFLFDVTEQKQTEAEVRRLNLELEQRVADRTAQLAAANRELEAFCYSVSHDLRAPLRAIDGFSKALLEDCADRLGAAGRDYLGRVCSAARRMAELIDDLLALSRVARAEMRRTTVNLSALAEQVVANLRQGAPGRDVRVTIAPGLTALGDANLLRLVLENLLGNAWKYTGKQASAEIEFGELPGEDGRAFFVRDDGAGFDPAYTSKLFQPFQRLHRPDEFEGHGIGLATVQRIVHRHGGHVWGRGEVGKGATFFFSFAPAAKEGPATKPGGGTTCATE
jgi:PAS domain S-box-containing protein